MPVARAISSAESPRTTGELPISRIRGVAADAFAFAPIVSRSAKADRPPSMTGHGTTALTSMPQAQISRATKVSRLEPRIKKPPARRAEEKCDDQQHHRGNGAPEQMVGSPDAIARHRLVFDDEEQRR